MKILLVQPSPLIYSKIYMRLEPLGLERVAQAVRMAGHQVRLIDLQIYKQADYLKLLIGWRPQAVGFSLNYLANVPEIIDLAMETKRRLPTGFVFLGGHTASFIPEELLQYAEGAIDCIVRGEGEITAPLLLQEIPDGKWEAVPGIVTERNVAPPPALMPEPDLDVYLPARDLTRKRRRYFAGELDPCASIEFTRGCPYNCSFCSAWTFYNRTYRKASPEAIAEDLSKIDEPNVFLLDDVAFVDPEHALTIANEIEKRHIVKRFYAETRCDVLIRNQEIFARWKRLGLKFLFLGFEAIDEDRLKLFRKKVTLDKNFQALEVARKLGLIVALNIIVSPEWDQNRFRAVEKWAASVPEIVHLTVMTPYPGTETWFTENQNITTHDYRLFDIQHAVTPTLLPLRRFYEELAQTQQVLYRKHLKRGNVYQAAKKIGKCLFNGQTNFAKAVLKYKFVHDPQRQYNDHFMPVKYALRPPDAVSAADMQQHLKGLYVHSAP